MKASWLLGAMGSVNAFENEFSNPFMQIQKKGMVINMNINRKKQFVILGLVVSLILGSTGCAENTVTNTPQTLPEKEDEPIVFTEPAFLPDRQDGYASEFPSATTLQALDKDIDVVGSTMSGETYMDGQTTLDKYKLPVKEGDTTTPQTKTVSTQNADSEIPANDELKAIWISYLDFAAIMTGKTEQQFIKNISQAFDNVKNMGLNTVIVQVRPYGDALYESEYFPWSYVATGTEGKDPGYDPLEIMVAAAKERDLLIEAWINPYRVRTSDKKEAISADNPVKKMLKSGDAISYKGGTYYNPASQEARDLITNGVTELLSYDIDGIHFDDYFYPTTDAAFDTSDYSAYKKGGGKLSLADWRRDNVNKLVKQVYNSIKEIDNTIVFGISPQGNMDNNYNLQFIDVELWLSEPGYIDYICPQVYFGFENAICPYAETVDAWNDLVKLDDVKLYVGLAPFKVGKEDTWAGVGKKEWVTSKDLMSRMVESARDQSSYGGFILFRYDSIFHPASGVKKQVDTEMKNLQEVLD